MPSLIVTIIAVSLTMAVAATTMYYAGPATNQGDVAATAATLVTQAEQVSAAVQFRAFQTKQATLASVTELHAENYLTSIPVPPESAYSTGLSPLATDWHVVTPAPAPVIVLRNKIREDVCLKFNEQLNKGRLIREAIDVTRRIQCFGPKEPYTVIINPSESPKALEDAVLTWHNTTADPATATPPSTPVATEPTNPTNPTAENSPSIVEGGGAVTASGEISLATATLPVGKVGVPYSYDLKSLYRDSRTSTPDMSAVTWSVEPALPAGLTLKTPQAVIEGTPTVPVTDTVYMVTAMSNGLAGTQAYTLNIKNDKFQVSYISRSNASVCSVTLMGGGVLCFGPSLTATATTRGYLGVVKGVVPPTGTPTSVPIPLPVYTLKTGIREVASGDFFQCALTTENTVKCWGRNLQGALGDGTTVSKNYPVDVLGLSNVRSISAGTFHACAVTYEDSLYCWGLGGTSSLVPLIPHGLSSGVATVSAGYNRTCFKTTANEAFCWGDNSSGSIGNDSLAYQRTPYKINKIPGSIKEIKTGQYHTCAINSSNELYCWGSNDKSQLSQTPHVSVSKVPVKVSKINNDIKDVALGSAHTCALTLSGAVQCWGANAGYPNRTDGPLGIGYNSISAPPTQVVGLSGGVKQLVAGGNGTCAIKENNELVCWGFTTVDTCQYCTTYSGVPKGYTDYSELYWLNHL